MGVKCSYDNLTIFTMPRPAINNTERIAIVDLFHRNLRHVDQLLSFAGKQSTIRQITGLVMYIYRHTLPIWS